MSSDQDSRTILYNNNSWKARTESDGFQVEGKLRADNICNGAGSKCTNPNNIPTMTSVHSSSGSAGSMNTWITVATSGPGGSDTDKCSWTARAVCDTTNSSCEPRIRTRVANPRGTQVYPNCSSCSNTIWLTVWKTCIP